MEARGPSLRYWAILSSPSWKWCRIAPSIPADSLVCEGDHGDAGGRRQGVHVDDIVEADYTPREQEEIDVVPLQPAIEPEYPFGGVIPLYGRRAEGEPVDDAVRPHDHAGKDGAPVELLEALCYAQGAYASLVRERLHDASGEESLNILQRRRKLGVNEVTELME
jgi:hypothetical protein